MKTLDVVVPLYNEAGAIARFHASLVTMLRRSGRTWRIVYVNDGSNDDTLRRLRDIAQSHDEIVILDLSRNFGHQAALSAGLDAADADAVIMMDGDGQHPPALIPEMLRLYDSGYEIVQAQRRSSLAEGAFKSRTSVCFYRLISAIGEMKLHEGAADYRLISRDVLHTIQKMPEYHRFLRGMITWLGFRQVLLPYTPAERMGGVSKYTLRKMLRLASDGIFSFSLLPLRLGIVLGCVWIIFALIEASYVTSFWLRGNQKLLVPGWSSIIILTTLCGGIMMILLGFIGVYVGMIFQQVKGRPIYVIRSEAAKASGPPPG